MSSQKKEKSGKANNRKSMDMFYREYFGDDNIPCHSLPDLNDLLADDDDIDYEEDDIVPEARDEYSEYELNALLDANNIAMGLIQDYNEVYQPLYLYDPLPLARLTPEQASLYLPIPQVPAQVFPSAPVSPTFIGAPFEMNYPRTNRTNGYYLSYPPGYYNPCNMSPYPASSSQYYPYSYSPTLPPASPYEGEWQVSGQGYGPQPYYQGGFVNDQPYMLNWETLNFEDLNIDMQNQNAYTMNFPNEVPVEDQMPPEFDIFDCIPDF